MADAGDAQVLPKTKKKAASATGTGAPKKKVVKKVVRKVVKKKADGTTVGSPKVVKKQVRAGAAAGAAAGSPKTIRKSTSSSSTKAAGPKKTVTKVVKKTGTKAAPGTKAKTTTKKALGVGSPKADRTKAVVSPLKSSGGPVGAEAANRKAFFMKMKAQATAAAPVADTEPEEAEEEEVVAEPEPEPKPEPEPEPEPEVDQGPSAEELREQELLRKEQEEREAFHRAEKEREEREAAEKAAREAAEQQQADQERAEREARQAEEAARAEATAAAAKRLEADLGSETSPLNRLKAKVAITGRLTVYLLASGGGDETPEGARTFCEKHLPELMAQARSAGVQLVVSYLDPGTARAVFQSSLLRAAFREIDKADVVIGILTGNESPCPTSDDFDQLSTAHGWAREFEGRTQVEIEARYACLLRPGVRICQFVAQDPMADNNMQALTTELEASAEASGEDHKTDFTPFSPGSPRGAEAGYNGLKRILDVCCSGSFSLETFVSAPHLAYQGTRSRLFLGGDSQIDALDITVTEDPQPLVVHGPPGSGKSALVCSWVAHRRARHPEDTVIFHNVGITQQAKTLGGMLRHLTIKLRPDLPPSSVGSSAEGLVEGLAANIEKAAGLIKNGLLFIVLDGLDQLETASRADWLNAELHELTWLPRSLPDNVRLVVSCRPGFFLKALKAWDCNLQPVAELSDQIKADLARFCMTHSSQVRAGQVFADSNVQLKLSSDVTRNPMALVTFLRELLLSGPMETVGFRAPQLLQTATIADIVAVALHHFICSFKAIGADGQAAKFLAFLCVSNAGLSEADVHKLLYITGPKELAVWSCIRHMMAPFVVNFGGRYSFHNDLVAFLLSKKFEDKKKAQMLFAHHIQKLWEAHPDSPLVQARVFEERPHKRFQALGIWETFAGFIADAKYTEVVFPDHVLDLQTCAIDMDSAELIAGSLRKNDHFKYINLNDNQLGKFGTQAIADYLKSTNTVTHLNVSNNLMRDGGIEKLVSGLKANRSLTHLYVRVNNIGPAGAKHLADFLSTNTKLVCLSLDGNDIGDEGAQHLTSVLAQSNTTLKELSLLYNDLGDEAGASILEMLQHNRGIRVQVRGNDIGRAIMAQLPQEHH